MALIPLTAGAPTMLLAAAMLAQAPDLQPRGQKPRQPTSSSVQRQENLQVTTDTKGADADKKVRERDRRMTRTMRSICVGCQ